MKGCRPDGVILQHPPARTSRCDFPNLKMPTVESEIKLIEAISQVEVMAIALNHEDLSDKQVTDIMAIYEKKFQLATTDVLSHGCKKLVQALSHHFPELRQTIKQKRYIIPRLWSELPGRWKKGDIM